ncbi:MAG: TonB-dependent receptor plug domain-containing protein [Tangfeifania sp.]
MRLKFLFPVFMILLTVHSVSAQNVSDSVYIQEIQVLAKRKVEEAGLKISRPDSMARAASITTDLSDLIADYSPVYIKSYGAGSAATASFRGTAATHTQVLWNGMNLNSPMRGFADLSLLPVFFTDDVYLLHGGSSMTKGSGGLGGSIVLENKPNWNSGINFKTLAETGSFGSRKAFFKVNFGSEMAKSDTRVFYETAENDFPFYNSGIIPHRMDTLQNAGYRKAGILQEFYFRSYTGNFFTVRFWAQKSNRNLPQLMSYQGSEREEYQKDLLLRTQFEWKKYTHKLNYHFFTGINSTRLDYYRATPQFNFVNEDSESRETSFLNHLRIFRQFGEKAYATVSLDANYHEVQAKGRNNETGYRKNRLETSLLVNLHLKPSNRFIAYILMRSENYDKKIVPLIPSAGMEWQPFRNQPFLMRVNAARNYHKPTLNDLYWIPGGNAELLPEDGFTGDISFSGDFSFSKVIFSSEITGFLSGIENWIIWQPAENGAYFWEANNVKDVFSRGIEYSFTSEYNWKKIRFLSGGNYSFTRTSNLNAVSSVDQSRGKQLIYIPKHKGNIYLSAEWQKFVLRYDVNFVGRRFTKSSNTESDYERILNPYWLSKVTFEKQVNVQDLTFNLKFTANNLFDETYQSILWRPMPGRFYSFSAAINFKK